MKKAPDPSLTEAVPLSSKLARGDLMSAACPSRQVLNHVTSRWGVLVLMTLESGTCRFSALRRRISGVSERMLAQTLQQLEGDGFVRRVAFQVVPPHVEYSLTPLGVEVAAKVRSLADWIEVSLDRILPHWEMEASGPQVSGRKAQRAPELASRRPLLASSSARSLRG